MLNLLILVLLATANFGRDLHSDMIEEEIDISRRLQTFLKRIIKNHKRATKDVESVGGMEVEGKLKETDASRKVTREQTRFCTADETSKPRALSHPLESNIQAEEVGKELKHFSSGLKSTMMKNELVFDSKKEKQFEKKGLIRSVGGALKTTIVGTSKLLFRVAFWTLSFLIPTFVTVVAWTLSHLSVVLKHAFLFLLDAFGLKYLLRLFLWVLIFAGGIYWTRYEIKDLIVTSFTFLITLYFGKKSEWALVEHGKKGLIHAWDWVLNTVVENSSGKAAAVGKAARSMGSFYLNFFGKKKML